MIRKLFSRYIISNKKNYIYDKYKMRRYNFKYLGVNTRISDGFILGHTENLIIEDNVFISGEAYIDAVANITIKSGTMIGPRFTCIASNHNYDGNDLEAIPFDNKIYLDEVVIGENVWIGANVSVAPGVEIGEGAVIGMGVTVYKDVEPFSVVVGNCNRIIKYRDRDTYNKLKMKNRIYNSVCKFETSKFIEGKKNVKR